MLLCIPSKIYHHTPVPYSSHAGPNRGVPNHLASQNDRTSRINSTTIPSTQEAVSLFGSTGGQLGQPTVYGSDPLSGYPHLSDERCRLMEANLPSPEELFSSTVNDSIQEFASAAEYMIDITNDLERRYI